MHMPEAVNTRGYALQLVRQGWTAERPAPAGCVENAFGGRMRDQDIDIGWNACPCRREPWPILEECMGPQLWHPRRTEDSEASKIDSFILQEMRIPKRLRSMRQIGFENAIMIAARAQDAVEFLPPEPRVHRPNLLGCPAGEIEHVAAMDQQIAGGQVDLIMPAMRIADDRNARFHEDAYQPALTLEALVHMLG